MNNILSLRHSIAQKAGNKMLTLLGFNAMPNFQMHFIDNHSLLANMPSKNVLLQKCLLNLLLILKSLPIHDSFTNNELKGLHENFLIYLRRKFNLIIINSPF